MTFHGILRHPGYSCSLLVDDVTGASETLFCGRSSSKKNITHRTGFQRVGLDGLTFPVGKKEDFVLEFALEGTGLVEFRDLKLIEVSAIREVYQGRKVLTEAAFKPFQRIDALAISPDLIRSSTFAGWFSFHRVSTLGALGEHRSRMVLLPTRGSQSRHRFEPRLQFQPSKFRRHVSRGCPDGLGDGRGTRPFNGSECPREPYHQLLYSFSQYWLGESFGLAAVPGFPFRGPQVIGFFFS